MIARIALLLVSIPLLAHGADGLYHAFRSLTQAVVTCEQFHLARPSTSWVRITGCEADYVHAGYRAAGGRVTELVLPIRRAGSAAGEPAGLVVATTDPAVLALAQRAVDGPPDASQDAFLIAMLRIVTAMRVSREVEGLVRSPLEMLRSRGTLSGVRTPLADDATIVDLQERPGVLLAAIEAVVGAQALLVVLFLSVRGRPRGARQAPAREPQKADAAPAVSGVPVVPPATPEFRRLMLVNLPIHAEASALEHAPPLGPQLHVRAALSQVLPGITFNDYGLGQFQSADHTILLDIGVAPQVWTATLDVTGGAAAAALHRLMTQTGWRVYAPRLGRFITAEDLSVGR